MKGCTTENHKISPTFGGRVDTRPRPQATTHKNATSKCSRPTTKIHTRVSRGKRNCRFAAKQLVGLTFQISSNLHFTFSNDVVHAHASVYVCVCVCLQKLNYTYIYILYIQNKSSKTLPATTSLHAIKSHIYHINILLNNENEIN